MKKTVVTLMLAAMIAVPQMAQATARGLAVALELCGKIERMG